MPVEELPPTPAPRGGTAPLLTESTGQLNLRPEVLEGFLAVRTQVQQLQALMHQVMRRVALPRCRDIGKELIRVRAYYPKGKVGRGGVSSHFYRDAEAVTGLKKRSLQGYIAIAENWSRLVDYMADLPEGATPITGLRGALDAIREMNRPLRPAYEEGAIEAAASPVIDGSDGGEPAPAQPRTRYAATAREKVLPVLSGLVATTVLTDLQRERLSKVQEMLQHLLDDIDATEAKQTEAGPASPALVEQPLREPVPAPVQQQQEEEEEDESAGQGQAFSEAFPPTREGHEALEAAVVEFGSGSLLGAQYGVSRSAVCHRRKKLRKLFG